MLKKKKEIQGSPGYEIGTCNEQDNFLRSTNCLVDRLLNKKAKHVFIP